MLVIFKVEIHFLDPDIQLNVRLSRIPGRISDLVGYPAAILEFGNATLRSIQLRLGFDQLSNWPISDDRIFSLVTGYPAKAGY